MAAPMRHVFRIARNLSKNSVICAYNSTKIKRVFICRTLCSDPSNSDVKKLNLAKPRDRRKEKAEKRESEKATQGTGLEDELVKAAESVAKTLGGDVAQTQSDLLQQLQAHAGKTDEPEKEMEQVEADTFSMGELLSSMKYERPQKAGKRRGAVQRSKPRENLSTSTYSPSEDDDEPARDRIETFSKLTQQRKYQPMTETLKGPRLNIFNQRKEDQQEKDLAVPEVPTNPLFDEAEAQALRLHTTAPPSNAFEEMIQWTKEGKLWHFPIDNEQGLEEEKKVGFHEHVFLEGLLTGFPDSQPIQHFMELVTTGLSQNPYMTVQQKKEHVDWFREYINSKRQFIQDPQESEKASSSA